MKFVDTRYSVIEVFRATGRRSELQPSDRPATDQRQTSFSSGGLGEQRADLTLDASGILCAITPVHVANDPTPIDDV
jgi:hypothetical protein